MREREKRREESVYMCAKEKERKGDVGESECVYVCI